MPGSAPPGDAGCNTHFAPRHATYARRRALAYRPVFGLKRHEISPLSAVQTSSIRPECPHLLHAPGYVSNTLRASAEHATTRAPTPSRRRQSDALAPHATHWARKLGRLSACPVAPQRMSALRALEPDWRRRPTVTVVSSPSNSKAIVLGGFMVERDAHCVPCPHPGPPAVSPSRRAPRVALVPR
jgi:hypothetical protein